MRASEFWRLVDEEFGPRGRTLVRDHVLGELGHRTVQQAIDDGDPMQQAWFALCRDLEVPPERWWGRDVALERRPGASRASNTRSG